MPNRVIIIILNWNNAHDTLDCLSSLVASNCPNCKVLVVDNGSTDDSVLIIRARFPGIQILETGANLGYAGGNNVGIRQALSVGAEAICILNNDVTVDPGFLEPLLTALQSQSDVGVVTPLVAEQTEGGSLVWALGSAVNWRTAEVTRQYAGESLASWCQNAPFEVEIASGAAMLVKSEVFQRVGLLDEEFFLYYEETDWCLSVRKIGYRILAVPEAIVYHKVSATLGATSPVIDYYMTRNHLTLIARHWPRPGRYNLWVGTFVRHLVTIAVFTIKPHGGRRLPHRNARLYALGDALKRRRGPMGPRIAAACGRDIVKNSACS